VASVDRKRRRPDQPAVSRKFILREDAKERARKKVKTKRKR
jgi:hypothetical protein